jgi:hypothetical protein
MEFENVGHEEFSGSFGSDCFGAGYEMCHLGEAVNNN